MAPLLPARAGLGQRFAGGRDGRSNHQPVLNVDVAGHRRSRVHRVERGREPQRGRPHRHRRQRLCSAATANGAISPAAKLPISCRRRNCWRWLDGRKLDAVIHLGAISSTTATDGDAHHGKQFPAVAAAARLVRRDAHALHLCLLRRDLWRRRARLFRRLVARRAQAAQADESLRLEQASVRSRGRRARLAARTRCRRNGPG